MRTRSHGLSDFKWSDTLPPLSHHPPPTYALPILSAAAICSDPAVSLKWVTVPGILNSWYFLPFFLIIPNLAQMSPSQRGLEWQALPVWSGNFPYIALKVSQPGTLHNLKPSRMIGHPWETVPGYSIQNKPDPVIPRAAIISLSL